MNMKKIQHHQPLHFRISKTTLPRFPPSFPHLFPKLPFQSSSLSFSNKTAQSCKFSSLSKTEQSVYFDDEEEREGPSNGSGSMVEFEDLATNGAVYMKTLRLVECSMFAAVTGLVYFLSNSLAIENYFGCFFSLPIVISSIRWGVACGRKQLVATVMLLFVLCGPVKALNYLLTHGILGFTMGALWRLGADWNVSILLCTLVMFSPLCTFFLIRSNGILFIFRTSVADNFLKLQARSMGVVGYVLTTSFLIRENILALVVVYPFYIPNLYTYFSIRI
ncbi:hypothetical protein REPUB_Repub01dG0036800 [Reevesia pubescens]